MDEDAQGKPTPQSQEAIPEVDASLRDFLLENADPEKEFGCKLFRTYRTPHTNQERCSYLTSYAGYVPTYDEIRGLVGAGKYRLNLIYTDKKGKRTATGRVFEIDPDPTQPTAAVVPAALAGQPSPQAFSPQDMVQLFTAMMRTIADIAKSGSNGKSAGADLSDMTGAFASSIGKMASQQMGIVTDMQRQLLDLPEPEAKVERPEGIVDFLVWAWNTFGQKILKSPALGKLAAPQVRNMPQVEYLMDNPAEYMQIVNEFSEETKVDRGRLDKLLHALDLNTPEELIAQVQPAAEAAGQQAPDQAPQ